MRNTWLRAQLCNVPLWVDEGYLQSVMQVVGERLGLETPDGLLDLEAQYARPELPHKKSQYAYLDDNQMLAMADAVPGVAGNDDVAQRPSIQVIPILGSLVARGGRLRADSSTLRGYNEIKNEIYLARQDPNIHGAVLLCDGPGGTAGMCMETSRFIREQASDDFPIWTAMENVAASATYAMGTAGQRVNAEPSTLVGSVGVIYTHIDYSEALKNAGIGYTFLTAGRKKALGNGAEPLSAEAEKELRYRVDESAQQFYSLVADHRESLTQNQIKRQEAGVFFAADAMDEGLVDSVGSTHEFIAELVDYVQPRSSAASAAQLQTRETMSQPSKNGGAGSAPAASQSTGAATAAASEPDIAEIQANAAKAAIERSNAIWSHPNAQVDAEFTAELVADFSVKTERVTTMLDRMTPADASNGDGGSGAEPPKDDPLKAYGDLSGVSAESKSVLQLVERRLGSPKVAVNASDPLDKNNLEIKPEEKTRAQIEEEELDALFGKRPAAEGGQ